MCTYIFAGRFQPFHNGHMQVFQQICEKLTSTDTLVLGVIAPFESKDIKDISFLEASKEHHLPDRNPWDVSIPLYAISLVARASHYGGQIITTLLPRPEYGWSTIKLWFPQKCIWVIPSAGEEFDDRKSDFFCQMGDSVIRFPDTTGISGRELRDFYNKKQYDKFASNVPSGVADIYFNEKPDDNAENDFQNRAKGFENHSKWVTDQKINDVPKNFFQHQNLGNLLDAGGGTGYLSWYLYQHIKSDHFKTISLVDISRNMLDEAERKNNYPVKVFNLSLETFCKMVAHKFDTILIRQVLHYVDNVNDVIRMLSNILSDNGIIYVGQILVNDNESKEWHDELMKDISKNRRRTFIYKDFINYFTQNGFEIIEVQSTNFEEKFTDLFERRISTLEKTPESIRLKMEKLSTNSLKEKLSLRFENDDFYYTVKFCHLFLRKRLDTD